MTTNSPTVTSPQRYALPIPDNTWGWCRLSEVIEIAKNVAAANQVKYEVENTIDFVYRFCLLANTRSVSDGRFLFSHGETLQAYTHEDLDVMEPPPEFDDSTFVPEGWVLDVLKVIQKGGTRVFGGKLKQPGWPAAPAGVLLCSGKTTGGQEVLFFAGV